MSNHPSAPRRVLMVCHDFPPNLSPGTFRALRFCRHLPDLGWRPIVLTVDERSYAPYAAMDPGLAREIPAGLEVHRTALWRPGVRLESWWNAVLRRGGTAGGSRTLVTEASNAAEPGSNSAAAPSNSAPARLPAWRVKLREWIDLVCGTPDHELGWLIPATRRGLQLVRRYRPDVIYSTGPPHSAHLVGLALRTLTGVPHVLDLRDPWSAMPWGHSGGWKRNSLMRWYERRCVPGAAAVILNTDRMLAEFAQLHPDVPPSKLSVITNGIDEWLAERIDRILAEEPVRPRSTPQGRWVLCHPGHVYGKRDVRPLVYALEQLRLRGRDVTLHQVGATPPAQRSELDAKLTRPEVVSYSAGMAHEDLLREMARSDILVILQQGTEIQIPSKIFEMILMRKPILALTGPGETADLVRGHRLGVVADGLDVEQIAAGVEAILNWGDSPLGGMDGELVGQEFNAQRLTARLANVLARAAKGTAKRCAAR